MNRRNLKIPYGGYLFPCLVTVLVTITASAFAAQPLVQSLPATHGSLPRTNSSSRTASGVKIEAMQVESMHLLGNKSGWAAGQHQLFLTNDGGNRWNDITPASLQKGSIESVYFIDLLHGWVVSSMPQVDKGSGSRFLISRTDNGGISWKTHAVALQGEDGGEAVSMTFSDAQHGWVMLRLPSSSNFSFGRLLATNDGGSTWNVLSNPPVSGAITFVSPRIGWLSGGAGNATMYGTHDGGADWQRERLPGLATPTSANYGLPAFSNAHDGSVPVISRQNGKSLLSVYKTSDRGRTWQLGTATTLANGLLTPVVSITSDGGTVFVAQPGREGLSVFGQGQQAGSGLHTLGMLLSASEAITKIDFSNSAEGWVLTASGQCSAGKSQCSQQTRLLATSDGGLSMTDVTPRIIASRSGSASGPTPMAVSNNTGRGFDQCAAGSISQMNNSWWPNTPWSWANIYMGGANRGCGQSNLTSNWVNAILTRGWKLVPTWVGLQGPGSSCGGCSQMSSNLSTARQQGINEANAATNAANALGLNPPTIIYYDMERYDPTSNSAVRAFIDGWTLGLHQRGNQAGVYGAGVNANNDWSQVANVPDAVWIADWNGNTSVYGLSGLSDNLWTNHQRIHQYQGGHNETWGGVTFNIDSNSTDGPVAN